MYLGIDARNRPSSEQQYVCSDIIDRPDRSFDGKYIDMSGRRENVLR